MRVRLTCVRVPINKYLLPHPTTSAPSVLPFQGPIADLNNLLDFFLGVGSCTRSRVKEIRQSVIYGSNEINHPTSPYTPFGDLSSMSFELWSVLWKVFNREPNRGGC